MMELESRELLVLRNAGGLRWARPVGLAPSTVKKVLSLHTLNGSESNTGSYFLPAHTVCSVLTNIILLSIIHRKKLKHLQLPPMHGCVIGFLFPAGPNLSWHYFH